MGFADCGPKAFKHSRTAGASTFANHANCLVINSFTLEQSMVQFPPLLCGTRNWWKTKNLGFWPPVTQQSPTENEWSHGLGTLQTHWPDARPSKPAINRGNARACKWHVASNMNDRWMVHQTRKLNLQKAAGDERQQCVCWSQPPKICPVFNRRAPVDT